MTFSIVGTGNMAWFLTRKLSEAGHTCLGVYGRDAVKAQELAFGIKCPVYDKLSDISGLSDCCILAISDNAIIEVAKQLSFKETVMIHTAGSVSIEALLNTSDNLAVVWPIYSILKTDAPRHKNIPTVWEANTTKAKEMAEIVGNSFSDMLFFADSEQRQWLHLSAVFANNFTNHLYAICEDITVSNKVTFPLLFPIMIQTMERITSNSPTDIQTGPAKRGDDVIMQKHIDMLKQHSDWQEVYNALSKSIKNMYSNRTQRE